MKTIYRTIVSIVVIVLNTFAASAQANMEKVIEEMSKHPDCNFEVVVIRNKNKGKKDRTIITVTLNDSTLVHKFLAAAEKDEPDADQIIKGQKGGKLNNVTMAFQTAEESKIYTFSVNGNQLNLSAIWGGNEHEMPKTSELSDFLNKNFKDLSLEDLERIQRGIPLTKSK